MCVVASFLDEFSNFRLTLSGERSNGDEAVRWVSACSRRGPMKCRSVSGVIFFGGGGVGFRDVCRASLLRLQHASFGVTKMVSRVMVWTNFGLVYKLDQCVDL